MTKREQRVTEAFINCIRHGEYTEAYAITLIEDDARYGWLTDGAKDAFYAALEPVPVPEEEPIQADVPGTAEEGEEVTAGDADLQEDAGTTNEDIETE